mmetsp:Transcript_4940/g.5490  ORF Transcript_4940/g.5490 Transcript_4940/m.5490 type:complete len:534 (+) Transcript_4940:56-1657(+)
MSGDRNDHILPFQNTTRKGAGQRRLVLSEEEYTSKLSKIVERDYFPDVSNLERQNALLDCRLRGDVVGAVFVRRESRRLMGSEEDINAQRERDDYDLLETDNSALYDQKTIAVCDNGRLVRKFPRPLHEENLTGFHVRATNEDDDEFDSNLKRDIQVNRQRLAGVFQKNNGNNGNSSESYSNTSLRLEMASDDYAPETNRIGWKEWKQPKMQNSLFFNPTPGSDSSGQNYDNDRRNTKFLLGNDSTSPAFVKEATSRMLPPSKKQTQDMLSIQRNTAESHTPMLKSQLMEYIPKHSLEKKIEPNATRFPSKIRPFLPVASKENGILDHAIDSDTDVDYMCSTDASTDLDAPLRPVEKERLRFRRQPKSYQQSYVAMTPQIIPGAGNESPITTWGTAGTPIILSGGQQQELDITLSSSISTSPFQISSTSGRERAARKAEKMLSKRAKLGSSSSSSFKARKRKSTGSLTPAALSLLKKTKSIQSQSRDAFSSSLRKTYTPRIHSSALPSSCMKNRRSSSQSKKRDHAYNATPQT